MIVIRPVEAIDTTPQTIAFHFRILDAMDRLRTGKESSCVVDLRDAPIVGAVARNLLMHFIRWALRHDACLVVILML